MTTRDEYRDIVDAIIAAVPSQADISLVAVETGSDKVIVRIHTSTVGLVVGRRGETAETIRGAIARIIGTDRHVELDIVDGVEPGIAAPHRPLLGESDPELERLLQEEEESDRRRMRAIDAFGPPEPGPYAVGEWVEGADGELMFQEASSAVARFEPSNLKRYEVECQGCWRTVIVDATNVTLAFQFETLSDGRQCIWAIVHAEVPIREYWLETELGTQGKTVELPEDRLRGVTGKRHRVHVCPSDGGSGDREPRNPPPPPPRKATAQLSEDIVSP